MTLDLLLYIEDILIGVIYYSQGRDENNKTTFFTLNLDPKYNNNGYRKLLYNKMLESVKIFNCNKVHTSIYNHPNYEEVKKAKPELVTQLDFIESMGENTPKFDKFD